MQGKAHSSITTLKLLELGVKGEALLLAGRSQPCRLPGQVINPTWLT